MTENDRVQDGASPGAEPEEGTGSPPVGHGENRDPIGQILGDRFAVEEEIGSGAFAVTYRGRDLRLGRTVAIKVLRRTYALDPTFVQRFEREARAAASVSHGNVVDVYDVGRQGDVLYMVLQFIDGEDLKHLIGREGSLPLRRAVEITLQMLPGLTAIHQAGIIHRDIKPQNVMIGRDGIARVTDFGIAHVTVDAGLTTAGTTVGTASYMAPEQAQAGGLVKATDLYSVGIVLYEMLTARLPFEAPTMIALMMAHIQTLPIAPSARVPGLHIPSAVDAVVMRALAKQPEDRFGDAPEMASALTAAIGQVAPEEELTRPMPVVGAATVRPGREPSWQEANSWPPAPAGPIAQNESAPVMPRRFAPGWIRAVPLMLVLLLLLGAGLGGAAYLRSLNDDGNGPDGDGRELAANLDPTSTPTMAPVPLPTDTPVPAPSETPTPVPTDTPVPTPTETPAPAVLGEPEIITIDFAASEWQGAYFQEEGNLRPWAAVYAQSTGYGKGTLTFTIDGQPVSDRFILTVDGMTSENWAELPISIYINDQQMYVGNSPFRTWNGVDGEQPWTTISIEIPTSALLPGENTVSFVNGIAEGEFSRPPYILLADGTLKIEVRQPSGATIPPVAMTTRALAHRPRQSRGCRLTRCDSSVQQGSCSALGSGGRWNCTHLRSWPSGALQDHGVSRGSITRISSGMPGCIRWASPRNRGAGLAFRGRDEDADQGVQPRRGKCRGGKEQ